jgi:hypothetical protein
MPSTCTSKSKKTRQRQQRAATGTGTGSRRTVPTAAAPRTDRPARRADPRGVSGGGLIYHIAPPNGALVRACRRWSPFRDEADATRPRPTAAIPDQRQIPAEPLPQPDVAEDDAVAAQLLLALAAAPVEPPVRPSQRPPRRSATLAQSRIDRYVWTPAAFAGRKSATRA